MSVCVVRRCDSPREAGSISVTVESVAIIELLSTKLLE